MAETGDYLDATEESILEYIRDQPGKFAGTAEIAEKLDLTTNGAAYRLKQLSEDGHLDSRQPSRDEIWYIPKSERVMAATPTGAATVAADQGSKRLFAGVLEWRGWKSKFARHFATFFLVVNFTAVGFWFGVTGSPYAGIPDWIGHMAGLWLFGLGAFGLAEMMNRSREQPFAPTIRKKVAAVGDWAYIRLKVFAGRWSN